MSCKTPSIPNMPNKAGILLVNLGTPSSPRRRDVFTYLNEFLTDFRVIDLSWLKRQLLVRAAIVPFRFFQSAKQYHRIWTDKGSPLLFYSQTLRDRLQDRLGDNFKVALAMRYQTPSIESGLEELQKSNVSQILILPLFPQYASATTGSVHQKVMELISKWLVIPKLTFLNHFFDHPGFINAFCERVKEHDHASFDRILFSFHGLPERHVRDADKNGKCLTQDCCQRMSSDNQFCYRAQCFATAQAIATQLRLKPESYIVCFQSRLGRDPWLQPYAADVLASCATRGDKRLLVLSPSFICDCLETLFEIAYEYKKEFTQAGGEELQLVTGLNDHPIWINALHSIVLKEFTNLNS